MAKKSKDGDTLDFGDSHKRPQKSLIQKSRPLLSLSTTEMPLSELKILDVYLSRIDSHDESSRSVRLKKGEIERLLGVTRIQEPDLTKRLLGLSQSVKVKDETDPNRFVLISLFEKIDAKRTEDGSWEIVLTCTNKAKEYIFNIENIGYLRYQLEHVVNLMSRYSYVLYLWLKQNRYRHTWTTDLEELKTFLQCSDGLYEQFKWFNAKILKRVQEEINEKTDIHFEYKPIKEGKQCVAVRFTVEEKPRSGFEGTQRPMLSDPGWVSPHIESLRNICRPCWDADPEFSVAEMMELDEIVRGVLKDQVAFDIAPEDLFAKEYRYVTTNYAKLNDVAEAYDVNDRFSYFSAMLKNGAASFYTT